jgi:hypothetical protein
MNYAMARFDRHLLIHEVFCKGRATHTCLTNVRLEFAFLPDEWLGTYSDNEHTVTINAKLAEEEPFKPGKWCVVVLHELYHGWQYRNGILTKNVRAKYNRYGGTYFKIEIACDKWAVAVLRDIWWRLGIRHDIEPEIEEYLELRYGVCDFADMPYAGTKFKKGAP